MPSHSALLFFGACQLRVTPALIIATFRRILGATRASVCSLLYTSRFCCADVRRPKARRPRVSNDVGVFPWCEARGYIFAFEEFASASLRAPLEKR